MEATTYQGGQATGVRCALPSCQATATSGSWRRGWPLEGGQHANLCNRCGQRWAKDKKSVEEGTPVPALGSKKRSGGEAGEGGAASLAQKRHKELSAAPGGATAVARPAKPAMARPGAPKPAAAKPAFKPPFKPAVAAPPARTPPPPAPAPAATPATQHLQPPPAAQRPPQPLWQPPTGPQPKFVSYAIQKTSSSKGNHALFWLQDDHGQHTLAVVGTDARLSGHFTYATSPDFTLAPPLRCTNRTEVTAWLASFGVNELRAEGSVGPLPELDAAERKRLLTGEPVWARPQIDMSGWTAVREESGRLTDGRHFKRFFLLGPGGAERLAVTGVDSHRKDRRYKYFAEEEMGGFAFENSSEVLSWLNFVLDRPADAPIETQQVRAAAALTEAELGTAAASTQPALTVRTKPPGGAARAPGGMRREVQQLVAESEALGAVDSGAGGLRRRDPASAGGSAACFGTLAPSGRGFVPSPSQRLQPLAAPAAEVAASGLELGFGGKIRPHKAPLALRFRCACCGMTDHDSDECPLAAMSPTMLIRRPTLDKGIFQDPSLAGYHAAGSSGCLFASGPTTPPSIGAPHALGAPGVAAAGALGGVSAGGSVAVLEFHAGERTLTPQVQAAYQEFPRLQQWVAATPSSYTLETFRAWAKRLRGHITDTPPEPSATPEEEPLGGWRWVPTSEALAILHQLNSAQVNLALLEGTEISRAVAMLRTHRNDEISRLAEAIVQKWRACAVAALHHATTALEQTV